MEISTCKKRLRRFIKRNLPIHGNLVLESLHLKFSTFPFQHEDIESIVYLQIVRELNIVYSPGSGYPNTLSRNQEDCILANCLFP